MSFCEKNIGLFDLSGVGLNTSVIYNPEKWQLVLEWQIFFNKVI